MYSSSRLLITVFLLITFQFCQSPKGEIVFPSALSSSMGNTEMIEGKENYLNSPFVTAGDRLYMVGHQNGQFPDLGWHVKGEMGGIWDHPIKLMDGFSAQIGSEGEEEQFCLDDAKQFVNYPFANKHAFEIPDLDVEIERFQFVPDATEGLVVEYRIQNNKGRAQTLVLNFTGLVDLRPVWLGEKSGMVDAQDEAAWNEEKQAWMAKDTQNDWFTVFGSSLKPANHIQGENGCKVERLGQGVNASVSYEFTVQADQEAVIPFFIAGSYTSEANAWTTYQKLKSSSSELLLAKKERYENIENTASLTIPDKDLEQAFRWVKYNTDWLIRDVPEVGRGLSAGIPDYPWWFGCDNTYSLQGVLGTGRPELATSTMKLLLKLSRQVNDNGRTMHEASTNGVVFNLGNINETPHFISMAWRMFEWTGDEELLSECYQDAKKGLEWLMKEKDADGNLYPDGFGMMEIHGLNSEMIDVVVYTQQAFEAAARMASFFGEMEEAREYAEKAYQLRSKINTEWWSESAQSYADFIEGQEKSLKLLEEAIIRADTLGKAWAVEELEVKKEELEKLSPNQKKGHVFYHNWVVNTPMEIGIAEPEKALKALETAQRFRNIYGSYVTGIDGDAKEMTGDSGSFGETKKKETFNYTGAVMTLPTGVAAIAEARYGRTDASLDYLKRLTRSFSYALPGSIYEVSPDYGMITQAWNVYAIVQPIVNFYFGIQPKAYEKRITVKPQMPTGWDNAKLENLIIAENSLSVEKKTENGQVKFIITQTHPEWEIDLVLPSPNEVIVNGNSQIPTQIPDGYALTLEGTSNEILIQE